MRYRYYCMAEGVMANWRRKKKNVWYIDVKKDKFHLLGNFHSLSCTLVSARK